MDGLSGLSRLRPPGVNVGEDIVVRGSTNEADQPTEEKYKPDSETTDMTCVFGKQ